MKKTKEARVTSAKKCQIRDIVRWFFYIIGTFLAIYVGGWLMIVCPIQDIYKEIQTGMLQVRRIVKDIVKIIFAATAGGAIWSLGYIVGNQFRIYEDEV